MDLFKGSRFYRLVNNDIEEVRIVKFNNENSISVLFTKGENIGNQKKISIDDLRSEYTKLKEDGFITFTIVDVNGTHDVMVTLNRMSDYEENMSGTPYCVCRQCLVDLFAKQLTPGNIDYVGMSVSTDTCPGDVDYNNFLVCDKMIYSEVISYYIGDKLEDVVRRINAKIFNDTLYNLHDSHCKYLAGNSKFKYLTLRDKPVVDGYCKDIYTLLKINNFEYDIFAGFGIIPMDLSAKEIYLEDANEQWCLTPYCRDILSKLILMNIDKSIVVPYEKDIDLEAIKRRYMLISDNKENVYVVAFTTNGRIYSDILNVESKENVEKLGRYIPSESVQMALRTIDFKKEKYL